MTHSLTTDAHKPPTRSTLISAINNYTVSSIKTRKTAKQSKEEEVEEFPDPISPKAQSTPQPRQKKFTIVDNIFTIVSLILFITLFYQWFFITLNRWVEKLKEQGLAGRQLQG